MKQLYAEHTDIMHDDLLYCINIKMIKYVLVSLFTVYDKDLQTILAHVDNVI